MRRFLMIGLLGLAGAGLWAEGDPLSAWVGSHQSAKLGDLTVGDLATLAQAESVERQQLFYVHSAGFASLLIPGAGQFKVGDPVGGTLHLVGQLALVGATAYGAWTLLPTDLQSTSLNPDQRRDLWHHYWMTDPAKVAGTAAVLAGGLTLSVLHSVWAAKDARTQAEQNVVSGKVTFEPMLVGNQLGFGMRM